MDEITLDECGMTASMMLDEMPVAPKRMSLEIDREPEVMTCDVENDAQAEAKKTKKKEKAKRKNMQSRIFDSYVVWCLCMLCVFMHAHVKLRNTLL